MGTLKQNGQILGLFKQKRALSYVHSTGKISVFELFSLKMVEIYIQISSEQFHKPYRKVVVTPSGNTALCNLVLISEVNGKLKMFTIEIVRRYIYIVHTHLRLSALFAKNHVKVQSMTEPLTKLTCKRRSHNQCPETETHAIEMLSHILDSVSLSSDVIMSYIVDDAIYKV